MERHQINLRLDKEEIELWRGRAAAAGISLTEWIRRACNAIEIPGTQVRFLEQVGEETQIDGEETGQTGTCGPVAEVRAVAKRAKRIRAISKEGKVCPHGQKVGWRCTLCGGVVK